MLRALANVSSVATACAAWVVLGILILDVAGADPLSVRSHTAAPAAPPPNELCALGAPLSQGFDRHCDFTARLTSGAQAFVVTLDESWEGTTLVQRLVVKPPDAGIPAHAVTTRSASSLGATRLSQVALVAATPREDHLIYSIGNCGGVICGQHDVVVLGAPDGAPRELLRLRLGRAGGFEVRDGGFVTLEPYVPPGMAAATGLTARTYLWDGTGYALRGAAVRASASPTSSTR